MFFYLFNIRWVVFSYFLVMIYIACAPFGHDLQRAGQVGVGFFCFLFLLYKERNRPSVRGGVAGFLLLILVMGFFSSLESHRPGWAFVEISVFILSLTSALVLYSYRVCNEEQGDKLFLIFTFVLCAAKMAQFVVGVVSIFLGGVKILDTGLLFEGFSNKRFYGQFQTFTLPILALPLLLPALKRSIRIFIFCFLSFWWLVAITGGTRGTWLGVGVAACVLFAAGHSGKRWIIWQLLAVFTGITLYWLLFNVLTNFFGIDVINAASGRLTTSLSARDVIWQQAWDMIRERPWLGFGPMHFADIHNPIAAHPHQAILQWACEWGIPSTLLVMWLVGRGLWVTFRLIRERADSNDPVDLLRVCLFASLIGALTQSMVDGVIVMPYSQLWLSLVVGWLMGIHVWKSEPAKPSVFIHWFWMGISSAAVLFLVYVVIRDVPHLDERNKLYQQQYGGHFQPRFWAQGVIAIKPE